MMASHNELEPRIVCEAPYGSSVEKWKDTIDDEMEFMRINEAWDLVNLPTGRKPIGNKLVLKVK